jgi:hypothetical protein
MTRRSSTAIIAVLFVCSVFGAEPVSRRDAARLQAKLDRITKNSGNRGKPASIAVTETEVNSYLRYELADCRFSTTGGWRGRRPSTWRAWARAASRPGCSTRSTS